MTFFERFETASKHITNQLWQNDYLSTAARNDALAQISPPLEVRFWVERLLLVLSALFICASILLFFAFNWTHMPAMIKMGGILGFIGVLGVINWLLLRQGKAFAADIILTVAAFMVGVFMAVFGQIYQTGADAYTLFLTWALMILPWAIVARFLPLWILWLVVCNIAMFIWWDLRLYPAAFEDNYLAFMVSFFHIMLYAIMLFAIKLGEEWLDKKWLKILLAIGMFVPLMVYMFEPIVSLRAADLDLGFWVSLVIFAAIYLYEKFIRKSLPEYSVGFFCATILIISVLSRVIFDAIPEAAGFLLSGGLIIVMFFYAYKYYRYATRDFEETLL